MTTFILLACLWYASGIAGFIYHFTKQYDITLSDVVVLLFVGFMGPISFPVGAWIHGAGKDDVVLIKRRNYE